MREDDFFSKNRKRQGDDKFEYYEDTHNERGEYTGRDYAGNFAFSKSPTMQNMSLAAMPDTREYISPRNYQNVVVYEPKNPDDVQRLIDYMKRREPAIVNLDNVEPDAAQRILDFISGAIYALSGSVHRIASNIFLLSPEGVEITVPYEPKL